MLKLHTMLDSVMAQGRQINFSPAVYEHAAALIGRMPGVVSRDPELLFQAHAEAFRRYRHAPVVVGIDIYNLEAEAYGAIVDAPAGNTVPSISDFPCSAIADVEKLKSLDPAGDGRIPMVIETGRRLACAFPEADVRVPVSGPFSLASNLVGFDILLCELLDDPRSVGRALNFLALGQSALCREIIARGLGIVLFESGATPPLISPHMFDEIELPALKIVIGEASAAAARPVSCIIGGDTLPIIRSICETGAGYVICPFETDQAGFMREMRARPDVMVRINMDVRVFNSGEPATIYAEIERILALAGDRDKVCIGTGVLPFDIDPELVLKARAFAMGKSDEHKWTYE